MMIVFLCLKKMVVCMIKRMLLVLLSFKRFVCVFLRLFGKRSKRICYVINLLLVDIVCLS